jgi:hypothetical protein
MDRSNRRSCRILAALLRACLCVLVLGPTAVRAAGELDARYRVSTTGIEIGRAALSLRRGDGGLTVGFSFENGSLLGLVEPSLTRMRSILAEEHRRETRALRYDALFRKEDRDREVSLGYAEAGTVQSYRLVKRGRVRVDQVPPGLPQNTLDPMAALTQVRAWLERATEGDALTLALFDGRKRYDAALRFMGSVQTNHDGMSVAAHQVTARYRLVAELDEDKGVFQPVDGSRERQLEALMSVDGRYVPLRLSGSFDGLPLTAELVADCATPPGCEPEE